MTEYQVIVHLPTGKFPGLVQWYRDGKISVWYGDRDYGVYEDWQVEWLGAKPEMVLPLHLRNLSPEEQKEYIQSLQERRMPQERPESKPKTTVKKTVKTTPEPTFSKEEFLSLPPELQKEMLKKWGLA